MVDNKFTMSIYKIIKIARNGESCIASFNTEYEAIKVVNELVPYLNDGNNINLVVM